MALKLMLLVVYMQDIINLHKIKDTVVDNAVEVSKSEYYECAWVSKKLQRQLRKKKLNNK